MASTSLKKNEFMYTLRLVNEPILCGYYGNTDGKISY